MKIGLKKTVDVDATEIRLHVKCTDYFTAHIHDKEGDELGGQDDGYVPSFFPGEHYGDYIILNIDLKSGKILNWVEPSADDIIEFIEGEE